MTKPGDQSEKMKIRFSTVTGKVEKIKDEQERPDTKLSKTESEQIYKSPNTKHLGEILYTHSSPG